MTEGADSLISEIVWIDRETMRYSENGFSVLLWVDYDASFFSRARILRTSSIESWENTPKGASSRITSDQRDRIISNLLSYFKRKGVVCRVEN